MDIKFKNKPSDELIKRYRKKLEEFLSVHNVSVSIKLWNHPLQFQSYMNGKLTEIINHWIEKIIIDSDKIKDFEVFILKFGIDEEITDREIWSNAWWIQDQIYRHLKLMPGPPSEGDPYWRLWDHLEKLKE